MQTNKQTSDIVESTIKRTRREMFQIFNILPWILLSIVLCFGMFYFRNEANEALKTKMPITNSPITRSITNLPIQTNSTKKVSKATKEREGSPTIVYTQMVYRYEDTNVYTNIVIDIDALYAGLEKLDRLSRGYEAILHDVSNVLYRFDSETKISFVRTGEINSGNSVFTASDAITAERIGYDLQKEITEQNLATIEYEFQKWDGSVAGLSRMKENLKRGISSNVKRAFDGFNTYNKLKGR